MPMTRRRLLGASLATLGLAHPAAFAQSWPSRPVHLIAPYGAGGSNDILTRLLGDALATRLGQGVVVENKAGAGTRIANEYVARAAPDGYTVLHAAAPIAIGEALYPKLPYDVKKDYEAVVSTAIAPLFLIVNAEAPYKTVAEFVAYGKAQAKGLTFGSPGAGSAPHLTAELLMRAAGTPGVVIQFRGDAPAYNELLAGRIDATLTAISTAVPHIQAGKLRVLAVANEERTPLYPQAPTFRESGFPSVVGYGWYGLMVPAGTPPAIVQRLNRDLNDFLKEADVKDVLEKQGLLPEGGASQALGERVKLELARWTRVVKAAKIKAD